MSSPHHIKLASVLDDYTLALQTWLREGGEDSLTHAYELGRSLITNGHGVVLLADIHVNALDRIALTEGAVTTGLAQQADRFLGEALAPFEMALAGFQEANHTLRRLNETLEARVQERTHELELAKQSFRLLVERIPGIVFSARLGDDDVLAYVSPQVQPMLGYPRDAFTLQTWEDRIHPEDRAARRGCWQRAVAAGGATHCEYRIHTAQGKVRRLREEVQLVQDDDTADVITLHGIAMDVTEQRALEAQVQRIRRLEAVGRLSSGVAHDFNNILAVVMASAELARFSLEDEHPAVVDIEEIVLAAERGAHLTRQLLAFSRREVSDPTHLSVNDVLRGIQRLLSRLLGGHIDLLLDLDDSCGSVRIDTGHVEQILLNLVVNARDAITGGAGGSIHVRTRPDHLDADDLLDQPGCEPGEYVLIEVEDDGDGIQPEIVDRIFEPFYTTKDAGAGTGLGLATLLDIVRKNCGKVAVESTPGVGTIFRVHLPVSEPEDVAEPPRPPAQKPGDQPTVGPRRRRVLLVEDSPALRAALQRTLESGGFDVVSHGDGAKAIAWIESQGKSIDLLVSDVVLPGASGGRVAAALKDVQPDASVLFISGYADDELVHHGVEQQAATFLQKPFAPRQLLDRLIALCDAEE